MVDFKLADARIQQVTPEITAKAQELLELMDSFFPDSDNLDEVSRNMNRMAMAIKVLAMTQAATTNINLNIILMGVAQGFGASIAQFVMIDYINDAHSECSEHALLVAKAEASVYLTLDPDKSTTPARRTTH